MTEIKRPKGGQPGNRNAAKLQPGLRGQFYLSVAVVTKITRELKAQGIEASKENILDYARQRMFECLID